MRAVRLAYLVSHPIQYQAPLLRRIAAEHGIELTVLFGSDFSVRGYRDRGFGVEVRWDVPLLEGYRWEVLRSWRDTGMVSATSPVSRGMWGALRGRREERGRGESRFDALWVHGYASVMAWQGMAAAKMLGLPVMVRAESWMGDRERAWWTLAAKRVFFWGLGRVVDAVLPIGSHNAAYWQRYLPETAQFPMPYAVENGFFGARAEAARSGLGKLRAELGLEEGRPVVLFASKLERRKGAGLLLEAFAGLEPVWRPYLVIVGDGEERAELEERVRREGVEGVRFVGFRNQSELPRFFALADVFCLPSRWEPWGLVVNEAMATGCAVIVSDEVGAARDLVEDGVTGWVFRAGDVEALRARLENAMRLWSGDQEALRTMGRRGQRRMGSWDFEADVRGVRAALRHVAGLR